MCFDDNWLLLFVKTKDHVMIPQHQT